MPTYRRARALACQSLLAKHELEQFRIDADHSNAFTAWLKMGSPAQPSAEQYAALQQAGQLEKFGEAESVRIESGQTVLHLTLPRQSVAILRAPMARAEIAGVAKPVCSAGLTLDVQPASDIIQFTPNDAGWSSPVAREAHNLEVTGSNPVPATL